MLFVSFVINSYRPIREELIKSLGIKTEYIPSADLVQLYNIFNCICLAYDLTVKGECKVT